MNKSDPTAAARAKAHSAIAVIDATCDDLRMAAVRLEARFDDDLKAARETDLAARKARDPEDKRQRWIPLKLQAVRSDGEHLHLRWTKTVPLSLNEKKVRYVSLRASAAGDFNLRTLHACVPEFMHSIVTDVELEARHLRKAWREAMKLRTSIRTFADPAWRLKGSS